MNEKPTILIIDDEVKIIEIVKTFLESRGYLVLTAENGEDGLEMFKRNSITLVLLDLMLPGISGEEICIKIRQTSRVPIIMLTAKITETDLVNGFDYGADDYITKPFGLKELNVRIEAVLRRSISDLTPLFQKSIFGDDDLVIDFESRIVLKKGQPVTLTPNEYKIFVALIKFPSKTFTRDELIQAALGQDFEGYDRAVDSHIKNIRQKIETDSKKPVYIITVHGIGYKFGGQ
ncbi:MAG: response regulator transcription factor [Erysipelotrichaceae bacterium]|nr:response regulator transcription factor [Erysipelotrichaceae bacterium]MDP3304532.1 response regulator transcription factor [Erysipelotrichaceae bacterium]